MDIDFEHVVNGDRGIIVDGVLGSARLPIALMSTERLQFRYANAAFCKLLGKSVKEVIGGTFHEMLPHESECLRLLIQSFRQRKCVVHSESSGPVPETVLWSYEIWPVGDFAGTASGRHGVALQITETGPLHRRAIVMNEALLLSSIRQHQMVEDAASRNVGLLAEIGECKRIEQEIERLAFYDVLTGLPNRRLFVDRLRHVSLTCARTRHHGAILFIDLDRFKFLNDTRGHHVGDLLLQQVAARLKDCVREGDTVARLGGDEFVVMLEGLSQDIEEAESQATTVARKILLTIGQPYLLAHHQHHCTGSIGIGLFNENAESVDALLNRADTAQYRVKSSGGNGVQFFSANFLSDVKATEALKADLCDAVTKRELKLHYQVQVDASGVVKGAEALVRWKHPKRGLLLPKEFVGLAERHGVIGSLGLWVIRTACAQLKTWEEDLATSQLTLSVNVSGQEFAPKEFVGRVLEIVDDSEVDPSKLILEITERTTFGRIDEMCEKMVSLRARGLSFALDDFGAGGSSLSLLKGLPLSQIKLDPSLVSHVLNSHVDRVIVESVITMAQNLGLEVVAEGVETSEQKRYLADCGCNLFQGHHFGRPVPISQLAFGDIL